MDWDELRQLRDAGWEIGSHTHTHPKLTEIGDEDLRSELVTSREVCSSELGDECRTLAYPYGLVDERVARAAGEAGYEAAASLRPGPPEPLRWPRIGIYPFDRGARLRLKVSPLVRAARSSGAGRLLEKTRQLSRRNPS
jgi:peptidoglycan/xylan/chitin deacetylase (PgdA/CDA1 family)